MSQSTDELYFELQALVRSHDIEREREIVSKVQTWTEILILADKNDDSLTLSYILKRNPYLLMTALQEKNCYPLHRLAMKLELTDDDIKVLPDLLACHYFGVSDLDADGCTMLGLAIDPKKNGIIDPAFLLALNQAERLRPALKNLKARLNKKTMKELVGEFLETNISAFLNLWVLDAFEVDEADSVNVCKRVRHQCSNNLPTIHPDILFQAVMKTEGIEVFLKNNNVYRSEAFNAYCLPSVRKFVIEQGTSILPNGHTLLTFSIEIRNENFCHYLTQEHPDLFSKMAWIQDPLQPLPLIAALNASYGWLADKIMSCFDPDERFDGQTLLTKAVSEVNETLFDYLHHQPELFKLLANQRNDQEMHPVMMAMEMNSQDQFIQLFEVEGVELDAGECEQLYQPIAKWIDECLEDCQPFLAAESYYLASLSTFGYMPTAPGSIASHFQEQYLSQPDVKCGLEKRLTQLFEIFVNLFGERELVSLSERPSCRLSSEIIEKFFQQRECLEPYIPESLFY